MNSKIFLFAIVGLLPMSSFAEYRMSVKFSDPSSISFGTVSNPGEETPEEPTDPVDSCPTSFPSPTFVSGYPSVLKSGANVSYSVKITAAGGYASMAEVTSGQRYVKILTTSVSGVDYGNGGIYVGDIQSWLVKTGQTINVVVTPVAYDMQEGTVCASGTPFTLVNKSLSQLYSEAQ